MTILDISYEQLNGSTKELKNIQLIAAVYLTQNSLEDSAYEFFREISALKSQNIHDTLIEIITGTEKYLEAIKIKIEYDQEIPKNIDLYANKLQKIAEAIESCWDIFSPETHTFFINLAHDFAQASNKFIGLQGLLLKIKLLLPSLSQQENLFKKYHQAILLIPQSVDKAVTLRKNKSTKILEETAQYLLAKVKEVEHKKNSLSSYMTNLGKTPEEQLAKNQKALVWAKKRLEEINNKRNQTLINN
jgi:hypothetical protein